MALAVNTNIASIRTNRALEVTQKELARSVQRISSGLRINSAKDDPAGLATADRLSVQIRSISVAIRNASDGISLAQTAEGSLQEITGMLQKAQELSVQASNPSNSLAARTSLNGEITQLKAEITRISEQTEFNSQKLLSGSMINVSFQVGMRPEEIINLSIPEVSSNNLGNFHALSNNRNEQALGSANVSTFQGDAPEGNFVTEQNVTVRGFNTKSNAPALQIDFDETAASIARKINDVASLTGVQAKAKTTLTLEGVFDESVNEPQNISFRLYGNNKKIGGETTNAAFVSATITEVSEPGYRPLVSAINAQKNITGITATYTGKGIVQLSHETGANISLENYTNTSESENEDSAADTLLVTGASGSPQQTLTEKTADDSVTVGGVITFNSPKPFSLSSDITSEAGSIFNNTVEDEPQASQFNSLSNIDLTTTEGAAGAIDIASNALEQISGFRSDLGAIQNRFETAISNLQSIQEQTQDARSRIIDTDFADEISRFTKAQIFQQAGIAILAQANAAPFAVLELLRS